MHNKSVGILIILLSFINFSASGQKKVNSPYHRFNFGELSYSGSFRSLAMGGTGVAMRDNSTIYFNNPASYTGIDTTSFLFDFGFDLSSFGLDDGTDEHFSTDMNFNHLMMGFPVGKKAGIGIGIVPVSNGYYYLAETVNSDHNDYDPVIGEYSNIYSGNGGITGYFLGAGYRITRNISAGINMNVILGEISRMNSIEFSDYSTSFNQRSSEVMRVSGLNFDYGLQYSAPLGKSWRMASGFSWSASKKITTSRELLKARFAIYSAYPYSPDTLAYSFNKSSDSTRLPETFRLGIAFSKKDMFTAELNYIYTKWSDALIHGDNSHLGNTSAWQIGFEFIPEKYSNTSFLKRIEYRMGLHYANNYLVINDIQLKEYGGSVGFGIRMRSQSLSKLSLYFDFTKRTGNIAEGLPDEDIYSLGLSLNLYDFWFLKRKYD